MRRLVGPDIPLPTYRTFAPPALEPSFQFTNATPTDVKSQQEMSAFLSGLGLRFFGSR
jgi:hypothetical protein